jgi:ribA/ribD-fused uncharacterized protein
VNATNDNIYALQLETTQQRESLKEICEKIELVNGKQPLDDIPTTSDLNTATSDNINTRNRKSIMTESSCHHSNYFLVQGKTDLLSNFQPCKVECNVGGKRYLYSSLEQGFQHRKARILNQPNTASEIMQESNPATIKSLGASLNPHPDVDVWNKIEQSVMKELLLENPAFLVRSETNLYQHGKQNSCIVRQIKSGGIGIYTTGVCHPLDLSQLKGGNLAGKLLMEIRDTATVTPKQTVQNVDVTKTTTNSVFGSQEGIQHTIQPIDEILPTHSARQQSDDAIKI